MKNIFRKMYIWPMIIAGTVLLGGLVYALLFFLDADAWIAAAAASALILVTTLIWALVLKNGLTESVTGVGLALNRELEATIFALDCPYALIGEKGQILWENKAFDAMVSSYGNAEQQQSSDVSVLFPQMDLWAWSEKDEEEDSTLGHLIAFGERMYSCRLERLESDLNLTVLTMTDETEHLETLEELDNQRCVVGLVAIDNYEEILKHTGTEQQGLLGAVVAQQIQNYFRKYGGVVCKTERDRFSVFLDKKALMQCEADRFSLMEEIKKIREGNSLPVSVSMAFGYEGLSFEDNLSQASHAMDLAMGRGGDQTVVKNPADVRYFGGKAMGESADTRVKSRVKAQALREIMLPCERVFIMGHKLGDNDSFGASVAMYRAAVTLNKKAHIVIDSVSFSVRPLWERFQVSADYPREMFLTGSEAEKRITKQDLLIVVDTNRGSITECPELLNRTDNIVVLDHHRQMSDAIGATLSYVEPYASSACEMSAEILQYFAENLRLKPMEAEVIYSGIVVDTNNFSDRTGARTFEAAAYLKRCGADLIQVKKLLRENYREYKAKAETLRDAEVLLGRFAFAVCRAEGLDSPTVIGAQVANELLNIADIQASFVFTEVGETTYVSARSIDEINVQLIMEKLGGGGHLSVAGAQFPGKKTEEVKRIVIDTIRTMLEEGVI